MLKSQVSYMTWHIWFFSLVVLCQFHKEHNAVPHYFKNHWRIKLEAVKRKKNEFDVQVTMRHDISL